MNIMVPLDGSQVAEQALDAALTLARKLGNSLTLQLVRVALPDPSLEIATGFGAPGASEAAYETSIRESEAYLKEVVARVSPPGVTLRGRTLSGDVTLALSTFAREQKVDLIMMVSHVRTGVAHALFGSVAEEVMREARVPTIMLRPGENVFHHVNAGDRLNIVVPLDGSALAEAVLAPVLPLAQAFKAHLRLVRVLPSSANHTPADHMLAREAERELATLAARFDHDGVTVTRTVMWGDVVSHIREVIRDETPALIALGTHGRAGLDRAMHGSVALDVLRHTLAPALLFHPPVNHPCWQSHPLTAWDALAK